MNYQWVWMKHGRIKSYNHQLVGDELARANKEGWARVNIDLDAASEPAVEEVPTDIEVLASGESLRDRLAAEKAPAR